MTRTLTFSTNAARDDAYTDLVGDALCIGDLTLAMQLSGMAASNGRRDALYSATIDAAIAKRQLTLAEAIANLVSSNSGRDAARKKKFSMPSAMEANHSVEPTASGLRPPAAAHLKR